MKKITIKDVAKAAGVSITTVSRALNEYPDVSDETREKVFRVASELNYSPNSIARGLVTSRTNTIGLIISEMIKPGVYHPYVLEQLSGVKASLRKAGYDIILFTVDPGMQEVTPFEKLRDDRKVDGMIAFGLRMSDPYIDEIRHCSIPTVLIDIPIVTDYVGYISSDNVEASFEAIEYLLNLGHRNVGFINGHKDAAVSFERLDGYKRALIDSGIGYRDGYVIYDDFTQEGGYNCFKQLLQENPEITAVFVASDLMAIGAMKAAIDMGLRVPEDVSIIGFDDIELATMVQPQLTTVRQEKFKLGYMAGEHLLHILKGGKPDHVVVPHKLIIRGSTSAR
ncbi:MAG: LacI family DNA-binding transcriptional regulator [Thermoanaerobacteraceae bacterium]|nr:LacI family DNA-binding transcriptional regulator [Thermoanaerobacteraceae bacterium]